MHRMSNKEEDKELLRSQILGEMTESCFGTNGIPLNPFAQRGVASRGVTTGDLYSDEELRKVLELHNELSKSKEQDFCPDVFDAPGSLHDLVLETLNGDSDCGDIEPPQPFSSSKFLIDENLGKRISNIRAVASDVDGTILSSRQTLHPRTRQAVVRAAKAASDPDDEHNFHFFPATGKSRKGALDSLGLEVGSLFSAMPGVFLQGLYCVDGEGKVVFEQKLKPSATKACEQLAQSANVSVVAYDGDNLYSTELNPPVVELHERYGEPMPQQIDELASHVESMHKILLMDDDINKLTMVVRPQLEALAKEHGASVTQAIPTMLEWLPAGCSKARGVKELCKALDLDPATELLAIGDAENDAEMLKMAAIGVAVGNACPLAKDSADFVMEETNDEGGAGCAIEWFGLRD